MKNIIDIKVGYLCNNHCLHCAIGDSKRDLQKENKNTDLNTSEVLSLIEKNAGNYSACVLTGGEITIRKDCIQIINHALKFYDSVQIQTNGRRITEDFLNKIDDVRRCFFAVAIHGPEEVHDVITQVKHSYTQTIRGLEALSKRSVGVCLKFVLSKINYKYCQHVVELAHQFGIARINVAYVHACGDARLNKEKLLVSYEDIKPYVTDALVLSEKYGIWTDLETFPMCKIDSRFYHCSDDMYMERTICVPVNQQSFDWEYTRKQLNKIHHTQCENCVFERICEGPWEEYNLSEMVPMYPNKPKLTGSKSDIIKKLKLMRGIDFCVEK